MDTCLSDEECNALLPVDSGSIESSILGMSRADGGTQFFEEANTTRYFEEYDAELSFLVDAFSSRPSSPASSSPAWEGGLAEDGSEETGAAQEEPGSGHECGEEDPLGLGEELERLDNPNAGNPNAGNPNADIPTPPGILGLPLLPTPTLTQPKRPSRAERRTREFLRDSLVNDDAEGLTLACEANPGLLHFKTARQENLAHLAVSHMAFRFVPV